MITGLTEAQKIEYAWQVNVARRQLSKAQKRQLADKLWHDGQTQERIAQLLGVSQPTIANWVREFIKSDKLPPSPTAEGKDGKHYPRTKTQRRTTYPTEQANRPETSQLPSDAGDGLAQAPVHQETPQPRDTPAEAQSPTSELAVASDVPDAPETPLLISDELQIEARQRASLPLGSGPIPAAEDDAEAHWMDALQDLTVRLETLQTQGSLLSPNRRWAPEARVRGMATIRRIQEICRELAAVVGADMSETAARNGHDVGDTPFPSLPPSVDAVQVQGNGEFVPVPAAEAPVEDVANSNQPSSTRGEITGSIPGASATLTEISGSANVADPVEPCSPNVLLNKHCPDHDCSEKASGSQEACLDGSLLLVRGQPLGSAGASDLPTANVPMAASAAPLPPCPQCESSNTWRIYGGRAGHFSCMKCLHNFKASTPGNVPSTPSQVSSHEIVQVASE